jgi:hypothetical protein
VKELEDMKAAAGAKTAAAAAFAILICLAASAPGGSLYVLAQESPPESAPAQPPREAPACVLVEVARTALQSAERGVALAGELERVVEARVAESRDAFKACNQAHMQKQRIASARAEATQRHAELEARFKTLEQNAAGASCPKAP